MMKNLGIPPPGDSLSRAIFWAQMRCWGRCLLVLTLWGGIGVAGLCSPFFFGENLKLSAGVSLSTFWLPFLFAAVVVWNCARDWQARLVLNSQGLDHWTRNGYAGEVDADHSDRFSCELESLSAILSVGKPRWFVSERKGLFIKVYTPAASASRAAILLTSDMLAAKFSLAGRRTLLAHELAHVRLRGYLFDMLCASANIVAWSGLAVAALFLPAYLGWHPLLLAVVIPATCWLASSIGDMVAALVSRIHEDSADRIADIVVGPGAIAACLIHLLHVQLCSMKKGKEKFFNRRRAPGFIGALRYFKGELLAEHPHELARIATSRKTKQECQ